MQVFIPFPRYLDSCKVLDKKRLFKQVVEIRQILAGMGERVKKNDGTYYRPTHKNHPIYETWRGCHCALMFYHDLLLGECRDRNIKTKIERFYPRTILEVFVNPYWFGDEDFHSRHRAALLAKDPKWYGQFGWTEKPIIDYRWE